MGIGSIGGIGGGSSFWQDDQNHWNNVQAQNQTQAANTSLINTMGSLMVNQFKGLASIANQKALDRTNSQLKSVLQDAIAQVQGGTSSSGTSGSSASAPTKPTKLAASGIGKVPLLANTSLATPGIVPTGSITVTAGKNTTTYTSTGTDTVRDLINAINNPNIAANAQVTAALNASGHLVLTSKNTTDAISVGGLFAGNVGFGTGNQTFSPTSASSKPSNATTSTTPTIFSLFGATSTPSRTASSSSSGKQSPYSAASYSAGTAASFLSGAISRDKSSSVNLLA
jgi:hypothetical protein